MRLPERPLGPASHERRGDRFCLQRQGPRGVLTGDRGLSGAYNNASLRAGERLIAKLISDGAQAQLITVGKKAGSYFRYRGIEVEANFVGFVDRPTYSDAQEIAVPARLEIAEIAILLQMDFCQPLHIGDTIPARHDEPNWKALIACKRLAVESVG